MVGLCSRHCRLTAAYPSPPKKLAPTPRERVLGLLRHRSKAGFGNASWPRGLSRAVCPLLPPSRAQPAGRRARLHDLGETPGRLVYDEPCNNVGLGRCVKHSAALRNCLTTCHMALFVRGYVTRLGRTCGFRKKFPDRGDHPTMIFQGAP